MLLLNIFFYIWPLDKLAFKMHINSVDTVNIMFKVHLFITSRPQVTTILLFYPVVVSQHCKKCIPFVIASVVIPILSHKGASGWGSYRLTFYCRLFGAPPYVN